jgi:hypothetical protein
MTDDNWQPPEILRDQIDDYLDDALEQSELEELEASLRADRRHLDYFIRYSQLHTDLGLHARAMKLSTRILASLPAPNRSRRPVKLWATLAGCFLLVALGVGAWYSSHSANGSVPEMQASLLRAQNCQWAANSVSGSRWPSGSHVLIKRGMAEYSLGDGTRLCLEGPCDLEILSVTQVFLHQGKLNIRVAAGANGFTVDSPTGRIVDLGTEFGVCVEPNGTTLVCVFEGKVRAESRGTQQILQQNQVAQLDTSGVMIREEQLLQQEFVRTILPDSKLVPRSQTIPFSEAVSNTLMDQLNQGIGLTHRLPGTGQKLPFLDDNLLLNLDAHELNLTTTDSDLNRQYKLEQGEYLGIRLKDQGFSGQEDFEVSAKFLNIPSSKPIGQFGLYVGTYADQTVRGGVIGRKDGDYSQFLVNNIQGRDHNLHSVGIHSPGNDLRIVLKRQSGKYTLTIENESTGTSSSLTIPSQHLDNTPDLYVGVFGANTQSTIPQKLKVRDFQTIIWIRE